MILGFQPCLGDPAGNRFSRGLGDLELDRPLSLLLQDDGAGGDPVSLRTLSFTRS
jgi:hypothetical protein